MSIRALNRCFLLSVVAACGLLTANAQVITTIAGTDFHFPTGHLTGINAPLGLTTSVAVDSAGNVVVSDFENSQIFSIAPDGAVTIVAGNGIAGFSGDGGPATSASLKGPAGIAIDSAGSIYIFDYLNYRVRKVTNGIITTVAGNGVSGFSGDGGPATLASIGEEADFAGVAGLAVDGAGNLYIADQGNNRIRKVSGGIITTFAGKGIQGFSGDGGPPASATLNQPLAVAVDSAGSLYIADSGNYAVRKVSGGTITSVAGNPNSILTGDGGPAIQALLQPLGLTLDAANNLYIGDLYNNTVRKVSGGIITTIAGDSDFGFSGDGGPATLAALDQPSGVALDGAGNLYIADAFNLRVRKVSNGVITTLAGNGGYSFAGDGGAAVDASLNGPQGVSLDSSGNLYIADLLNNRVRSLSNGTIRTVAGNGIKNFSGDRGLAVNASLDQPARVAVDAAGNLYIADFINCVIRKVSNGVITTIAGNGNQGFSGDGGPATRAELSYPTSVAIDSAGNLYIADSDNNRIRKVANGVITTIAGNGPTCTTNAPCGAFSGDGGSATSAALNGPVDVVIDASGNLYIADANNNRIRKVANGIITTIAGNGPTCTTNAPCGAFSGDGGAATSASLNFPRGVKVDAAGHVYIADAFNNRVREVSNGIISTIAGTGDRGFSGDGGAATAATLNRPYDVALGAAGSLYIADFDNNRIREILTSPPVIGSLTPGNSLSLTQASGARAVTANLNANATMSAGVSVSVPGMAYTASVTNGASWLSVSPQNGATPGLITVTANPLNLTPGVYNGTIAVSVPLANPSTQTVSVKFTVTAAIPATLTLDQSHMSFAYATTSAARSQTLIVSNTGGGSLNFTTSVVLNSGVSANWLNVAPLSGTATPDSPVSLAVTADPSKLGPGTYTASLTINGGATGSVTIPVTITITTNPLVMLLSQAGLTFTAIQNGGAIPPQTFGVLNLGSGTLNWTVQTSTLTGGDWLSATPASGSSNSASVNGAPLVSVSTNPAGLAPGVYYGLVKVISAGAANTPQEVVAVLQVLPAGSDLAPIVQPTSLLFTAPAGVSSPSSQTVSVYDPTGTGKSFRSGVVSSASIQTLPTDATIAANAPTQIVVQPGVNGLAPGTYNGTVTLQFSDGRVSTVGVTFVVTAASGGTSENPRAIPHDSGACTPTKLIPVLTTLGSGFNVPAGFPEGLTVQVSDDCGNPLTKGQVSVEFSTGQGLKYMQSLNNGRWDVTWNTGAQSSAVTLTVHATHPTLPIKGDAQITGALGALQAPPQILDRGVVSAASFTATPVAPGGFISIFGSLLSDATSSAQVLPLPTTLNNTTVRLGDQLLPLFYTNNGVQNQLNALVPYDTPLNTNLQLLVQRDNTYATPVYVDVAAAQPGVLQYGNNTQAVAVDLQGSLIGPSNPARAGDLLTMYCLGLGAVSPAVADGAAAPSDPPASTANTVTVTVGGQNANIYFAGLTPTLAGLYQINFYVPPNSGTGDQVPVLVSTAGQTSVTVNLSVR